MRAGFTLLEMMIVVLIIGIMAMVVLPSIGETMANQRAIRATRELVSLGQYARDAAKRTKRAHLLRYSEAGGNGHGRIQVHVGMTPQCRQTDWSKPFATDAANNHLESRKSLNMLHFNPKGILSGGVDSSSAQASDTNRHVIRTQARFGTAASTGMVICFQPDGQVLWANGDTALAAAGMTPQNNPATFRIRRIVSGLEVPFREVIFPAGGTPRQQL